MLSRWEKRDIFQNPNPKTLNISVHIYNLQFLKAHQVIFPIKNINITFKKFICKWISASYFCDL